MLIASPHYQYRASRGIDYWSMPLQCIRFSGSIYSQYAIDLILVSNEADLKGNYTDSSPMCASCKTNKLHKFFSSKSVWTDYRCLIAQNSDTGLFTDLIQNWINCIWYRPDGIFWKKMHHCIRPEFKFDTDLITQKSCIRPENYNLNIIGCVLVWLQRV